MKINPPITRAIIFSGGGGLVVRQQKMKAVPGKNVFEVLEVPASFDPDTTTVEIKTGQPEKVKLVQLSVKLPDKKTVEMVINRERTASDNIITNATDLRAESRHKILNICESAYYRQYEDMYGELNIIVKSEIEDEIDITIKYFILDPRIRWTPTLQVDLDEKNKTANIIGYINVNNNSDFLFENVELEFAEFELATTPIEYQPSMLLPEQEVQNIQSMVQAPVAVRKNVLQQLKRLKRVVK
ncbi:MAG: hypothetical protein ACTSRB_08060 [Candidatus Helarchaeota archaeon]